MNAKTTLLLLGALALSGFAVMAVFANRQAQPVDPTPVPDTRTEPSPGPSRPDPQEMVGAAAEAEESASTTRRRKAPPPGNGTGTISGRIAVASSLVGELSQYTIVVEEDINMNARDPKAPPPFRKSFPFKVERGTPFFDIENIPFSRYPYRVAVVARGMNGSFAITHVTEESPAGTEEVRLSLTPGVYFSVMVHDQRRNPRPGLEVHLLPLDSTRSDRTPMRATTSDIGQAVFESVLTGAWEIRVGEVRAPLAEPQKVQVHASFTARDITTGKPRAQGIAITVPDGHNVLVQVTNRYGYLIEGAEVKLQQIEIKRLFEYTGKTDAAGRCEFQNIPFGKYQVSVWKSGNGRTDSRITVDKEKPAPVVKAELPK